MPLLSNRRLILAKTETTYGTDPVPTGAANAILVRNLDITPQDADYANRDLVRAFLGRSEQLPASIRSKVSFEVEMCSSGAAGTAPQWGPLLKACGFGETIVASTSVTYAPVSANFSSVAIYFQVDGVQHKVLGARGTVSLSMKRREIPVFKFEFTGLYSAVTDTALATPTYSTTKPLPVNNVNTTAFSLHGYAGALSDLSVDMAMTVVHRDLVGGTQSVLLTDREPTGSVTIEAVTVATKDLWAVAQNATLGALAITQGTVAGNKVAIAASNVQLTNPSYTDQDGVQMLKMDMNFVPSNAGNDEISIICT